MDHATDASAAREERRARQLERLRYWRRACAERSPDVVDIGTDAGGRPFVFFHGDYEAGGTYLPRLAGAIGMPVVGISPHGLRGDPVPATVEAMAADRLALVVEASPEGPVRLGGYCNGAIVAYEVARLLEASGREVERVVMVEPPSLSVRRPYRWVHRAISAFAGLGPLTARDRRVGRAMYAVSEANRVSSSTPSQAWALAKRMVRGRGRVARSGNDEKVVAKAAALKRAYADSIPAYLPPSVGFPVTVMSSGRDAAGRRCALYDGRGWSGACTDFGHVQLGGSHLSCLMETTDGLAAHIRAALCAARRPAGRKASGFDGRGSAAAAWGAATTVP